MTDDQCSENNTVEQVHSQGDEPPVSDVPQELQVVRPDPLPMSRGEVVDWARDMLVQQQEASGQVHDHGQHLAETDH